MPVLTDEELDTLRSVWLLAAQADLRNGITDSTGSIDEGEVRGWALLEEARAVFLTHGIDPRQGRQRPSDAWVPQEGP